MLAEDKLYRWDGLALLAILSRTVAIDAVRAEVRRFSDKNLEKSFVIGSRSVLLPISTRWVIFPIVPPLDVLVRKIDAFSAAQITQEAVLR